MNDATSHLMSLLWKSSVNKYMIMVRSITNEIIKKMIKLISNCKDLIQVPSPNYGWTQAQKSQYNEFVESGLENWALMSWTTSEVD